VFATTVRVRRMRTSAGRGGSCTSVVGATPWPYVIVKWNSSSLLAEKGRVGASTQNQAASALLFLYREVIGRDVDRWEPLVRAKEPKRLHVVLSRESHLHRVKIRHSRDLRSGGGHVSLPGGLIRKYPNASREWVWQYVFPSPHAGPEPWCAGSAKSDRHNVIC